jgi:hypothetical protein
MVAEATKIRSVFGIDCLGCAHFDEQPKDQSFPESCLLLYEGLRYLVLLADLATSMPCRLVANQHKNYCVRPSQQYASLGA